ncbi:MAG: PKD domain-containing protein [Verrucomicrobia bacterium]|nr:PKD domain-containing protein [Verrucomicrobiota bacterium]
MNDGQVSDALGFSIVAQTVGTVEAAVSQPGETSTVSTAPQTAGEPGATVSVENGGDEPVTVLTASYDERPVGETVFQVDNGAFVDVQVTGEPETLEQVSATVFFYYPSTITGGMENRVKLRYFNGVDWIPVLSSGGLPPAKDTTDNLDGTVSGGRFAVSFDMTSTPTVLELGGTVFGMFESEPQLGEITGPTGPVALGNAVTMGVSFAVVGDPAGAQVRFQWDDGSETLIEPETAGQAEASHIYSAPGVYGVTVEVTDSEGDTRSGRFEYVVIYDPNGGFVTGGGWIQSPAGAYVFDATLAGKATFGFVSKYKKGQTVPTGETQFQFQAGDFKFHSTAYEWLVVSGAKAQYKGVGTVNGAGDYGFLLTATDGQLSGGGGIDKFRIKIWERTTGTLVYDNVMGEFDDMDAANPQAIGGGSIVIQRIK